MIDLSNHHIIVFGGSRGMGAASARMAATAGADVSIVYRNATDEAEAVCADVGAAGHRALAVQADIAERDACFRAAKQAAQELGPIHGVVISAGILTFDKLTTCSPETWQRVIDVNLSGTLWAAQAVLPHLAERASIIIYTSTAGQEAGPGASPYPVSKAGQIKMMKGLAQELGPEGIRVNCIAPAWTETDMANPHISHRKDEIASSFPLGRIGQADDVAKATCYLLSDLAGFVTGTTHTVDGGMSMKG